MARGQPWTRRFDTGRTLDRTTPTVHQCPASSRHSQCCSITPLQHSAHPNITASQASPRTSFIVTVCVKSPTVNSWNSLCENLHCYKSDASFPEDHAFDTLRFLFLMFLQIILKASYKSLTFPWSLAIQGLLKKGVLLMQQVCGFLPVLLS